jgi:hypothetical protein
VAVLRSQLHERRATDRVDGAASRRETSARRLVLAEPELIAPVEALSVVSTVHLIELDPPADVPHLRVGEIADEEPKRVGLPR